MDIRVQKFKTEYTGERAVDWIEYTSKDAFNEVGHAMHSTWERVNVLKPRDDVAKGAGGESGAAQRSIWAQIEPAYNAWKQGQEVPVNGTPLSSWSGLTADQADVLRSVGIKTVEDVAGMGEALLMRPPLPNLRDIRRTAGEFIAGRPAAEMADEIAKLKAQNEAMLEMLASHDDEKRGPGRPKKAA